MGLFKLLNKQTRADFEETYKSIDSKYYSHYFIFPFLISKQLAALHYCILGWKKKYNPSESFCTYYYLIKYPKIRESKINPFVHYLTLGIKEKHSSNFQTEREYFEIAPKFLFNSTSISKVICGPFVDSSYQLNKSSQYFDIGQYRRGLRFWKFLSLPILLKLHYFIKGSKNIITPSQIFKPWQTDFSDFFIDFLEQFESNKIMGVKLSNSYHAWIQENENADENVIKTEIRSFSYKPLISVVIPVFNPNINYFKEAIASVKNQSYTNWELCIADDKSKYSEILEYLNSLEKDNKVKVCYRTENGHISACSNSALKLSSGDYITLLDQDDLLSQNALFEVVKKLNEDPNIKLLFSNEDKIDKNGVRCDPYFKKGWNYHLLLSQNFVNHLGVYKRELVEKIGGFREGYEGSQDYDLLLRFIEKINEDEISYIDQFLYHWRAIEGSTALNIGEKNYAVDAGIKALQNHLDRTNQPAKAMRAELPEFYRVKRELITTPLVSIIIPTRNHLKDLKLAVDSVLNNNDYTNFELIIVDNDSNDPDTIEYLNQLTLLPKVCVLKYTGVFNYSAINNYAVKSANGELLLFLNNDVNAINNLWLSELVSQILVEDVSIVGAKLIYPDDTIQHVGVEIGLGGIAGHIFNGLQCDASGDFGRAQLIQNYKAVTGACLLIKKKDFLVVGGFNEVDLKVAFNDIDLCLKIGRLKKKVVYTPYAKLYHYESKSRGSDETKRNINRFTKEKNYMKLNWNID